MALSSTKLRDELEDALTDLTGDGAPDASERICAAWGEYFKQSSVAGSPPVPSLVDAGVALMAAAMNFTNGASASGGATVFNGALVIFWAHVQANAAAYWPGCVSGTLPTTLGGTLTTALTSAFGTNNSPSVTRLQAATSLASALHANAGLGGTVTIAAVPTPIL